MVRRKKPRASRSPGEEEVASGSPNHQHATPHLARSWRRRCRRTSSEWQGEDEARRLQVYRFRSRAPSMCQPCNGEGSSGLSGILALTGGGNVVEMLARSASYLLQQEPSRCWVRDCSGLDCSSGGHPCRRHQLQHHLLGEEENLTSLIREALLSVCEGNNNSNGDTGTVISQADSTSDDTPRSLAEEYSLAPLNTQQKYSAQGFDQQVENYLNSP